MKKYFCSADWSKALSLILAAGCASLANSAELYRAPTIPNTIDEVTFEAGNWTPHLAAGEAGVSWGNHRAVVVVDSDNALRMQPSAVLTTIPWRRRDTNPGEKAVVVVDEATGKVVSNVLVLRIENTSGDIVFQPNPGSARYHVYYLPWQSTGRYYPTITYPTQTEIMNVAAAPALDANSASKAGGQKGSNFSWTGLAPNPDPVWAETILATPIDDLPQARVTHIQSVNDFHAFFPMDVTATPEETAAFMASAAGDEGWALVPEHRDYPVRMQHFIPQHWATLSQAARMGSNDAAGASVATTPGAPFFFSRALQDEAFTFQLALISGGEPLEDVGVEFSGFPAGFSADALTCFNCGGVNEKGEAFEKTIHVAAETVQPLWLGIRIPANQKPGLIEGIVTVSSVNRGSQSVPVALEIQAGMAPNGGADSPEFMTRLTWLNSKVGTDPDFIIEPFAPVGMTVAAGDAAATPVATLSVLGREIQLAESGLPAQILSYYTPELTHFATKPEPVLAQPVDLAVEVAGAAEVFQWASMEASQESAGRASWTVQGTSAHFVMIVEGALEYDGMLDYRIALVAREDVAVDDIALPVDLQADAAEYMLGLGRKGGKRPAAVDWKWAVENHQEGVWLGAIHKGLQYVLRDDNYVRPLNTNFYRNQPLNMPPSWFNEGRGGIRITEEGGTVTARNYSGPRELLAGDTLHFNVRFLITPFKPIDTKTHFNTRFVHQSVPVDSVVAWGGTVVNIHHANAINPYINYPFFALGAQAAYIGEAHEKGIKFKLYNTIRELTYRAHELFALRSLGGEILNDGQGGGHSWMQEHMETNYHSAWHAYEVDDAAMLNKGTSRWTNYYIEGIRWLAENQQIDGLYLDDIAFSRATVKRIVTVLHEHRPEVVIDLHSANQFNVRDGFTNSAMLYMEHFPFISRLWFGEYFEYDLDEDYWMTEVSGLPFGLMGEMLQDGGHPYRGMLYGMTARKYGDTDPRPVWAMMNDFGIAESEMLGYWVPDPKVTTDHPRILATTYIRPGSTLIALASWSDTDEVVSLIVNWAGLKMGDASGAETSIRAFTPAVEGLQAAGEVDLSAVKIPAGTGLWIILKDD